MKLTLVLTGTHAGKTIKLNRKQFVNGECTLVGNAAELEFAARYLERCYGAKQKDQMNGVQYLNAPPAGPGNPEGVSGDQLRPSGEVHSEDGVLGNGHDPLGPTDGSPGMGAGGSGQSDSGLLPESVTKIRKALEVLDVKNDEHWTDAGLPSVEVVAKAIGDPQINRKMIDVVAPGWTREKAAEAADL